MTTGQFQSGQIPWNKDKKGIHLSPATEFKPGCQHRHPQQSADIGEVRVRIRKRDGRLRAWIKVANPNVWRLRAIIVWEEHHGPIPKGCVLHHVDRDTMNDSVTNLAVLSRAAHLLEHRPEFEEKRLERLISRKRSS